MRYMVRRSMLGVVDGLVFDTRALSVLVLPAQRGAMRKSWLRGCRSPFLPSGVSFCVLEPANWLACPTAYAIRHARGGCRKPSRHVRTF